MILMDSIRFGFNPTFFRKGINTMIDSNIPRFTARKFGYSGLLLAVLLAAVRLERDGLVIGDEQLPISGLHPIGCVVARRLSADLWPRRVRRSCPASTCRLPPATPRLR